MSGKAGRKSMSYSKATSRNITPHEEESGFSINTRNDPVDFDTEKLFLCGDRIRIFTKELKTLKPKIIKKRGQKESKHLAKCETEFNKSYGELTAEIKKIQNCLPSTIDDLKPQYHSDRQCTDCRSMQLKIWKQEQEVESLQKKVDNLQRQLKDERQEKEKAEMSSQKKIENLQRQLKEENQEKEKAVMSLRRNVDNLQRQLKEESQEREKAVMRLSEFASNKLRDNNPDIADLSDHNRPTKLAEEVSEMYDNEWTEAFDELEKTGYRDEEIIHMLRNTLMDIYDECRRINGDQYLKNVQTCIESADMVSPIPNTVELPDSLKQQIKEFRKLRAPRMVGEIVKNLLQCRRFSYLNNPPYVHRNTRNYVKKCIQVAWLMSVQDPPLELSIGTPYKFNVNVFREYTKKGPFVEYVVWPVLYLHENGPILCKGVAQGTKKDASDNIQSGEPQRRDFKQGSQSRRETDYYTENKFSKTVPVNSTSERPRLNDQGTFLMTPHRNNPNNLVSSALTSSGTAV